MLFMFLVIEESSELFSEISFLSEELTRGGYSSMDKEFFSIGEIGGLFGSCISLIILRGEDAHFVLVVDATSLHEAVSFNLFGEFSFS